MYRFCIRVFHFRDTIRNPLGSRGGVLANGAGVLENPAPRSLLLTLSLTSDGFPHPPETLTASVVETWEKAEGVGFEPTMPCGIPVFKTGAFDRSATPPRRLYTGTYVQIVFVIDSACNPFK